MALGGFAPLPLRLDAHGLTAQQHARIAADLVAISNVAPLAVLVHSQNNATDLDYYVSQPGVAAPTITLEGTGQTLYTWAAGYSNSYKEAGRFKITQVTASPCSVPGGLGVGVGFLTTEVVSPVSVRVVYTNHSGGTGNMPICLVVR